MRLNIIPLRKSFNNSEIRVFIFKNIFLSITKTSYKKL